MSFVHFIRDLDQPAKRGSQRVHVDYSGLVGQDFRWLFHEISSEFSKRVFDFLIEIFNRVARVHGAPALFQKIFELVERDLQLIDRLFGENKVRVAAHFPNYFLERIRNLVKRFFEFCIRELCLRDSFLRVRVHTQP